MNIDDGNFELLVIRSDKPFLLLVSAPWCQPCKSMKHILDKVAIENQAKLNCGVLNIDQSPIAPSRLNVRSVPTMLLFDNGRPIGQLTGIVDKSKIDELIR